MQEESKKIVPRPYQEAAIGPCVAALRKFGRALCVMATGLGKTFTAAFVAKEFRARRILFLVHNNFILAHAKREFEIVLGKSFSYAAYTGRDKKGAGQASAVFATWQTMGQNLEKWDRSHFDLVIVDEAHHSEAETYRKVALHFKGSRLGLTATPNRSDDADIRELFGKEVVDISLEEAIARGWLPRIEYHVVTDESLNEAELAKIAEEIRDSKRRFTMAEVNRRIFIRKRDKEIAKIINGYDEKAVVFCPSIPYAKRFVRSLHLAETFHSKKCRSQKATWKMNEKVLDDLHCGTVRRVCAVNAFNEGVNVPSVGLVAFCRCTESDTIFRQQLGRGLRPGKDKLIVLDFVGNLERIQLVHEMMEKIADMHEERIPASEREQEGYVRDKFEVSGKGFEFTFSDKIVDIFAIMSHVERDFYPTWQEASAAAIKLGFKTCSDHFKGYRKDERLPRSPNAAYKDFPGWPKFLGTEKYATWQEASTAAIRLGIRSSAEYKLKFKDDPRLPAVPSDAYADFPGLKVFLANQRKKYATWQEASAAADKLGIDTVNAYKYKKEYRRDPLLPSNPNIEYPDFPGFKIFLGKKKRSIYETWQKAGKAARDLKICSYTEYVDRYKKDDRLPSDPRSRYPDFPGWPKFLKVEEKPPKYSLWKEASRAALKIGIATSTEYGQRFKEDARLPSSPHTVYADFPGWPIFLGKKERRYYETWAEASRAATALKIENAVQYYQDYKKDPLLPSNPRDFYSSFPGWDRFLEKE